jgi:hypothetical protein
MAIDPSNSNLLYVGGACDMGSGYCGEVFKSIDGGNHWTNISGIISESYNYVNAIAVNPSSPQHILAGCDNGLYESFNAGQTWNKLATNIYSVSDIIFNTENNQIFVGSAYNGVFVSEDGAQTWQELNDNLNTLRIECLGLDAQNRYLFAGTDGGGLHRMDLTIESIADNKSLPIGYTLKQNYPNPFNPETIINYELPITNYVELSIYNLLGQKIATLVSEKQPPGTYQVTWNASAFSSGVYLYILKCGSFTEIRKMVLIR